MDEFVYVLLAGLALIIVAIFVWGGETGDGTGDIINETDVINPFSIGAFPQDVPRHIRIGDFKVSYAVGSEDLKTDTGVTVKKGTLSEDYHTMSVEIDKDMETVTSGFINLNILDTNSAGNLVVTVNDNVVFDQKVGRGKVEVTVDKSFLDEYNVVQVSTDKEGWKFWQSSFYDIDKVGFGVNFWGNTKKVEDFVVYQDEIDEFRSGEVVFDVDDITGIGDLIVEINGREMYRGEPNFDFTKSFEAAEVGLRKGENTISFSTESGVTYELDDAEIVIIHEEMGRKTRSFNFHVSVSEYENMDINNGKVTFRISDTNYEGNLLVTITDPDGEVHKTEAIQSYSIGDTITVRFGQDEVEPGTNKLNFEVSGDGNFVIGDVEIDLP
jgi:hypothetical protein